jgi:pimeloyl-ACP methyl ester carboxylesterase
MIHGGGGAWSHWIRNIGALSERYTVWAPDVPGLGESASPVPLTMEAVCEAVQNGADTLIPEGPVDVMGFSFGGPIATSLAVHLGPRLRNLVLAASRYVRGYKRVYPKLIGWKAIPDPLERLAAHKVNLGLMMMGHAEHIDALAVHIQSTNTARARFFGPKLNPGTKLLECLPHVRPSGRVTGICGREDQGAEGIIDQQDAALKLIHPTGEVHIVDNAGHWVQYEAAERFNQLALAALANPAR